MALLTTWLIVTSDMTNVFKSRLSLLSIATAFGMSCLLLRFATQSPLVQLARITTISLIGATTFLSNQMLFGFLEMDDDMALRFIGVLAIFSVLGLVITLILNKVSGSAPKPGQV